MNMGNPGEFTIRELAEKVVEMTGSKSVISYEPLPGDDPKQRKPDITLAREKLGWEPKVALEDGLVKTIAYFYQQLKNGMAYAFWQPCFCLSRPSAFWRLRLPCAPCWPCARPQRQPDARPAWLVFWVLLRAA